MNSAWSALDARVAYILSHRPARGLGGGGRTGLEQIRPLRISVFFKKKILKKSFFCIRLDKDRGKREIFSSPLGITGREPGGPNTKRSES